MTVGSVSWLVNHTKEEGEERYLLVSMSCAPVKKEEIPRTSSFSRSLLAIEDVIFFKNLKKPDTDQC